MNSTNANFDLQLRHITTERVFAVWILNITRSKRQKVTNISWLLLDFIFTETVKCPISDDALFTRIDRIYKKIQRLYQILCVFLSVFYYQSCLFFSALCIVLCFCVSDEGRLFTPPSPATCVQVSIGKNAGITQKVPFSVCRRHCPRYVHFYLNQEDCCRVASAARRQRSGILARSRRLVYHPL